MPKTKRLTVKDQLEGGLITVGPSVYHISHKRNRQSIEEHGLNPDYSDVWKYDARRGSPYPWTWFFTTLEAAVANRGHGFGTDVWEVLSEGVPFVPDPHDHGSTFTVATTARIERERIRRLDL